MWRLLMALPFVVLSGQSGLADDGCPYLTNEEVEKATGHKLDRFKLELMPFPDGKGVACESPAGGMIFLSGPDAEERFAALVESQGRSLDGKVPVAELGERAYALHLEPRTEFEKPTVLVVVNSDQGTAAVSIKGVAGVDLKTLEPQAIELAKIVVSKLP